MADTTFVDKVTLIVSSWLNQINRYVYAGSTAAAIRSLDSTQYTRFRTIGYKFVGKGAGDYYLDPTDTTSTDNGVTVFVATDGARWKLQYHGRLDAVQGGVVTDGVVDDTVALQGMMNLAVPFDLAPGRTRVTAMLSYGVGTRMYGENWATTTLNNETLDVSEIYYDGPSGAEAVIKVSGAAIGTLPAANVLYMNNCAMVGIAISANGKSKKGIYGVGCLFENDFSQLTVTGTTEDAFWFSECWGGSPRDWLAVRNQGKGITLGRNDYAWSSSNFDEIECHNFYGFENGCNSSGVPLNVFNETTNQDKNYGIGVFNARGLSFHNAQAELNDGAGIYISNKFFGSPNFWGGYCEGNGKSSSSTAQWNIWINGDSSANTAGFGFYGMYFGLTPAIRLTGTAPSRNERYILFDRIGLLTTVSADWNRYKLSNCDRGVTIIGTNPFWFGGQDWNSRSKNISAAGNFTTSGAALASVKMDGAVHLQADSPAGTVRNSAGNFTLNWSETYATGQYRVYFGAVPRGWQVSFVSKTTTSYTFTTDNAAVATDPTFQVDWQMLGDYT